MDKLPNIHPGEVLKLEFLEPLGISAYLLAKRIHVPQDRISKIIKGERAITADTAIRLSRFFGNSAAFWLNLQNRFDLEEEKNHKSKEFDAIATFEGNLL